MDNGVSQGEYCLLSSKFELYLSLPASIFLRRREKVIDHTYACVTSDKEFSTLGEYTAFLNIPTFCCCVKLDVIQKFSLFIAAILMQ